MRREALKSAARIALKVSIVLVLPFAGRAGFFASYSLLALWALRGPRSALESLSLCWLLVHLNPGLYPASGGAELMRWPVLGAAFASVALATLRGGARVPQTWSWVIAFAVGAALLSLPGEYLSLSLARLVIFAVGASAVLLAFHLTRDQHLYWQSWFLGFFAIVVVLGFPLIVQDVGYFRNGRGFQGLLAQPQAYGAFLAPFLAWLLCLLIGRRLHGLAPWLLALLALISLVATKSRTGAFAALLGLASAGLWVYLCRPLYLPISRRALQVLAPLAVVAAVFLLLNGGAIRDRVTEFATKGRDTMSVSGALYRSRGRFAMRSIESFRQHPIAGIGFGVPTNPDHFVVKRDPILGLPLGTKGRYEKITIEKAVGPTAVLEEVGILGFLLFLGLTVSLLRPAFTRTGGAPPVALGATAIFLTFGEAMFFNTGGTGVLIWLCVGLARLRGAAPA